MTNDMDIILQSLDIICESRIWKDKKPSDTLRILMYMHNKKWLYTPTVDRKVKAVIGAYRIPEVTDEILNRLPTEESGTILYICFAISLNKEDNIYRIARESLNTYLKENQDITELVLEGKDDSLKRYKIGETYGIKQRAEPTNTTVIC